MEGIGEARDELGFISNELLTANYTILHVLLDVVNINRQVCKLLREKELNEATARRKQALKSKMRNLEKLHQNVQQAKRSGPKANRCLFCAKKVQQQETDGEGCDNVSISYIVLLSHNLSYIYRMIFY